MSTRRDEIRADKAAAAAQRREDAAAAAQVRIAEQAAAAKLRREDKAVAEQTDQKRRDDRRARIARAATWAREHVIDLLAVPVIVVPAVLAWTAMATYGKHVFGEIGVLLPMFSEGAMWFFAVATTVRARRNPGTQVAHLQAGTAIFAVIAAVLNFVHGLDMQGGGVANGAVMGLVSVAGVVAHQLVTAGPRRTRGERDEATIARQVASRERKVRRAAVRQAVAELDERGHARLVFRPGRVALDGRTLVDAVVPGLPVPAAIEHVELADEITDWLATQTGTHPLGTAALPDFAELARPYQPLAGTAPDPRVRELAEQVRDAIATGDLPARPSRRKVRAHLRIRNEMAGEVMAELTRTDDDGAAGVAA
ncbi:hypothetical protein CFN78_28200 [Amycolatopsis antarctica]|uniref:DUF2637 domain-containing protein n=1 Tax=Amycolatopsis antarctica TaxID=1854586 RepID=A0A263CV92_9PSEU|nr:hypothetical protein [Amycolatopsis antarctica]OZM69908.1 hypothetical protein CFN78_28200 [Amycolatopsis antarctica]